MNSDEFASMVKPRAKCSRMEPFLHQIFDLRSKGYAHWQIKEFLARNGVDVTTEAVRKFIKRRQEKALPSIPTTLHQPMAGARGETLSTPPLGRRPTSVAPDTPHAGKTITEHVLTEQPKSFSFKQLQKGKDTP